MQVFIGLGTNMGNRKKNLSDAVEMINKLAGTVLRQSAIYETEPWGFSSDTLFLNMVVEIDSLLTPKKLLDILQGIEVSLGRVKSGCGYSSRPIDLDILFYDNVTINDPTLTIPHPLIEKRLFVLKPLNDLNPDMIHPVARKTIAELLDACTDNSFITQIAI